ncbi:MAG: phosphatidate cytidylyltransferase [Acidimicrobiia bacterium]|nr:phosphatidate cytidylyltransferase [Acidimicrobiia bacterium]
MNDELGRPEDDRPGDPTEGVRIIGAEEAAEALERGDVASRRGDDEPRFGDRPKPPPVGPKPALRFPLGADDPAELDAVRPASSGGFDPITGLGGRGGQRFDPMPDPDSIDDEPIVIEDDYALDHDDPTLDEPSPSSIDLTDEPQADLFSSDGAAEPGDEPAPVELPHWSDPPTGEVPEVLASGDSDDLDAWSSFATSSPRWRDSDRDWDDESVHEIFATEETGWRVGAMDDSRPAPDEVYSFDEVGAEPEANLTDFDHGPDLGFEPEWSEEVEDEVPAGAGPRPRRRVQPRRNPVAEYASGASGYAPPVSSGRDMQAAVAWGVGLVLVGLIAFKLGTAVTMALVVALLTICSFEFFNAVRRAGFQPATLLGNVAIFFAPLAVYWRGTAAFPLLVALTVMAALGWHLVGADGDARVIESVGVTLLGVAWIGGLGSFAALMLRGRDGVGFLIAAVLATVAYDVGALFVGRSVGERPLSEASPNKTVEGLVGGMLVALLATLAVFGVFGLHPFDSLGDAFIIGLAAAIAAPIGDLCESLLKRDLGVKDMAATLPGHGGFLDRFDAMLFVLPFVFYAAVAFHLGPFSV